MISIKISIFSRPFILRNLKTYLLHILILLIFVSCTLQSNNADNKSNSIHTTPETVFINSCPLSAAGKGEFLSRQLFDNDTSTFWTPIQNTAKGQTIEITLKYQPFIGFLSVKTLVNEENKLITAINVIVNHQQMFSASPHEPVKINEKVKHLIIEIDHTTAETVFENDDKQFDFDTLIIENHKSPVGISEIGFLDTSYQKMPVALSPEMTIFSNTTEPEYPINSNSLINNYLDCYFANTSERAHSYMQAIVLRSNTSFVLWKSGVSGTINRQEGNWKVIENKPDRVKLEFHLTQQWLYSDTLFQYETMQNTTFTGYITDNSLKIPEKGVAIYRELSPASFVDISKLSDDFVFDIKYATPDNFTGITLYECPRCLLRYEVAKALIKANQYFMTKGFRIKLFDCYRPWSVQKRMWEVYQNPNYLANPYTTASIHNRGGAVDLTLMDSTGNEMDMGTPFDFFGREAHFAHPNLPDIVKNNRVFLRSGLEQFGFRGIVTEWWHFSYYKAGRYPIADKPFNCY